jgi:hypothetical protein
MNNCILITTSKKGLSNDRLGYLILKKEGVVGDVEKVVTVYCHRLRKLGTDKFPIATFTGYMNKK